MFHFNKHNTFGFASSFNQNHSVNDNYLNRVKNQSFENQYILSDILACSITEYFSQALLYFDEQVGQVKMQTLLSAHFSWGRKSRADREAISAKSWSLKQVF